MATGHDADRCDPWVDHDVLGTRHPTRIGPIIAVVVTPPGPPDYGPPQLVGVAGSALGPNPGEPTLPLDAHPDDTATLAPSWTTYYAAEHAGNATALRTIGLELTEDPAAPLHNDTRGAAGNPQLSATYSVQGHPHARVADLAGRNIERWFGRLAEWVNVLTGQDLDHHHQLYDAQRIGPGLRTWHNGFWRPTSLDLTVPRVDQIGNDAWAAALGHVAHLRRPALEWQLMIQADRAAKRGQHRRALIDYATAVEVCLTRLAHSTLAVKYPSATTDIFRRFTLSKWPEWLDKHCDTFDADPRFEKDFVKLRNDCVHRAHDPTDDELHRASLCAAGIVAAHGRERTDPEA